MKILKMFTTISYT